MRARNSWGRSQSRTDQVAILPSPGRRHGRPGLLYLARRSVGTGECRPQGRRIGDTIDHGFEQFDADQAAAEAAEKAAELQQAMVASQVAAMAAIGDDSPDVEADLEAAQAVVAEAQEAVTEAQEAVAEAEAARQAEAATVVLSADGNQQYINDAEGNTATAITSDTGVVITMDSATLSTAPPATRATPATSAGPPTARRPPFLP